MSNALLNQAGQHVAPKNGFNALPPCPIKRWTTKLNLCQTKYLVVWAAVEEEEEKKKRLRPKMI